MEDYIERMCDESKSISSEISVMAGRMTKIYNFINSDTFNSLDTESQKMMHEQYCAIAKCKHDLEEYRTILDRRIMNELGRQYGKE